MRTRNEIAECLALHASGVNAVQIARRVGVPRSTVRDWLAGRVPRAAANGLDGACAACGDAAHSPEDLPRSYLDLLGIYLGDGCISSHRRGVFRLRVFLDARYPGIVDEVVAAVRELRPRNRVRRAFHPTPYADAAGSSDTCVEVSSYWKAWPCLIPQHGYGKKHDRAIALAVAAHAGRTRSQAPTQGPDPLRWLSLHE
jgi:hypothetical protein